MTVYVPGTEETDLKKIIMSLQQIGGVVSTNGTTAGHIVGSNGTDSAAAGEIGEYITNNLASASKLTLATGVSANITSIILTVGDWDVTGFINFEGSATPSTGYNRADLSQTSATITATEGRYAYGGGITSVTSDVTGSVPVSRFLLTATTTVYLIATSGIISGTIQAWGIISARRAR